MGFTLFRYKIKNKDHNLWLIKGHKWGHENEALYFTSPKSANNRASKIGHSCEIWRVSYQQNKSILYQIVTEIE